MQAVFRQMSIIHHNEISRVHDRVLIEINPVVHDSNFLCTLVCAPQYGRNVFSAPFHIGDGQPEFIGFVSHLTTQRLVCREDDGLLVGFDPCSCDEERDQCFSRAGWEFYANISLVGVARGVVGQDGT